MTSVNSPWMKLQRPSIFKNVAKFDPIVTKINHHQFIVSAKSSCELHENAATLGIMIYDTRTNQWNQLTKYPNNCGYDVMGPICTFNKHQNKIYLLAVKGLYEAINLFLEFVTFDMNTRKLEIKGIKAPYYEGSRIIPYGCQLIK